MLDPISSSFDDLIPIKAVTGYASHAIASYQLELHGQERQPQESAFPVP